MIDVKILIEAIVEVEEAHLNIDCIADVCGHADGECPDEYALGCGDAQEIADNYHRIRASR